MILWVVLVFTAMLFCFVPIGIVNAFGDIELSSIIFHFFVPLKNMSYDWLKDLTIFIVIALFLSIVFLGCIFVFKKFTKCFLTILLLIFLFDFYYLDKHFSLRQYIMDQYNESNFIKENYVVPKQETITFPEKKQNLIIIQVESLESSFQGINSGGLLDENYIPELTKIAQDNINFSSSNLVGGAIVLPESGWTMAGLIAETAGIPLKSYKIHKEKDQIGNQYNKHRSFLTQVISLGDILKQAGYRNYFILGSGKGFAAQGAYLQEHGDYEIYDHPVIRKELNVEMPDKKWWGLLDQDVYKFSQKKLIQISQSDIPFSMIIQTIDSHRDGFLSPDCPSKFDQNIKNVYSCVSFQLNDFIHWCMKQDFFPNTTIVIIGDHCNMSRTLFKNNISKETGLYEGEERKIYNAFINSKVEPQKTKKRLFSTMDFFPTILASIGVSIKGNRLGLGTNLFSERKTLLEEYGYDYLYKELRKKSNFYNQKLLYPK